MSGRELVSPATRLVADDVKATKRPSPDMARLSNTLPLLACAPPVAKETRLVCG
jgi:hypothetical protein